MKLSPVILFLAAFAHSKVFGDDFQCFQCDGENCNGSMEVVTCGATVTTTTATTMVPTTADTTAPSMFRNMASRRALIVALDNTATDPSSTTVSTASPTTTPTAASTTASVTTEAPTAAPTAASTTVSTDAPTAASTTAPTTVTTDSPTEAPTAAPTVAPTQAPPATNVIYACYTILYKDGSQSNTKRGCVATSLTESACSIASKEVVTGTVEKCNVCLESKCNSSATIKLSIIAMAIIMIVRFAM